MNSRVNRIQMCGEGIESLKSGIIHLEKVENVISELIPLSIANFTDALEKELRVFAEALLAKI